MKIVYKIYIICKINNFFFFFLQYCLLDLLVGVVQPSVLWKVATLVPGYTAGATCAQISSLDAVWAAIAACTMRRS